MLNQNDFIQLEPRKFVAPEYIFGTGTRLMVASYCKKLGAEKVLLVTDSGITKTAWFSEIQENLLNENVEYITYSDVSPNPRDFEVVKGAQLYVDERCNLIIAFGGGSVIDCAKGIGIITTNKGSIHDFEGVDKINKPIPPLVCIPTTSGSSADVSQFAIINNTREKYKMALISKALVPDVSLIDPILLTSMDPYLTACTGMDALSHAFEAFVSNANSPFTDMYSLEAIRLLKDNLNLSIQEPENHQVRGKVMLASLYAGLAFSNASLGCTHSLSHSLGGYLDLPHGECNAIMIPHVVDYNYNHASERYRKIASVIELEVGGLNSKQVKNKLINYLIDLRKSLKIFAALKDKGIGTDITPILAQKAIKDPCNATNPRTPSRGDLATLFNEAI